MVTKTRTRRYIMASGKGTVTSYVGSNKASTADSIIELHGYQITSSEGHRWPPRKGSLVDSGGGFTTQRAHFTGQAWEGRITNGPSGGVWYSYEGPIYAFSASHSAGPTNLINNSSNNVLDAFGTRAIAATAPTKPRSGMGQFLGEVKELPTIPRIKEWKVIANNFRKGYASKRRISERAASEWLNLQFGWIPFISELYKFGEAVRDAEKHMAQFDRDSGRAVRRKYALPSNTTTSISNLADSYGKPSMGFPLAVSPGKLTQSVTTTTDRWFSGCFTYYIPPSGVGGFSEQRRARQMLAYLYGVRATPDLIWSLAPWSWAVDWVSNVGSVIKNYSAFGNDNLVMRYGYVMETIRTETTYSLSGARMANTTVSCTQSFVQVAKKRRKATPYGFGLNENTFSARQWSIVAALGITKRPRSLDY